MGRSLLYLIAAAMAGLAAMALWPGRIDPAAWDPPPAPAMDGVYAPNDRLHEAELLLSLIHI